MTALITTATGKVGSAIAATMIEAGDCPRLYVRDAQKLAAMMPSGDYQVATGDLLDKEGMRQAMQGIEAVFMPGLDSFGSDLRYAENIISNAVDASVERIVFLSAFMADAGSDSPFVAMMGVLEDMVRASGLDYTMLGAEWFMENFFGYIASGELAMPFGQGRNSFVSVQDIAAVAVEALAGGKHANKSYILTGPETLDHDDVAAVVAEVTGKPCTYRALNEMEFREKTAGLGWEQWMTDLYVDITKFMRDGMVAGTSGDVEAVLGRPPISLREFVAMHRDEFAALCEPAA